MPRRPKQGHPLDGAADAAATATKHTRVIPDGAHYSGLGKDYGGMYNPNRGTTDRERWQILVNTVADAWNNGCVPGNDEESFRWAQRLIQEHADDA